MLKGLEGRPAPTDQDYLVPVEPYYDSLLQFRVLQSMGYPVKVEEISAQEIGDDVWPGDEYFQWQRQVYPYWANLVITNPEFKAKWVETCDCPGDLAVVDIGYQDLVYDHAIKLVYEVSIADYEVLHYYLRELKNTGEIDHFRSWQDNLITEDLLERCFMAALERRSQRLTNGYPNIEGLEHSLTPSGYDLELYNELTYQGQEAVKSEELMAVIWDYYSFLEKVSPEFAAFKQI